MLLRFRAPWFLCGPWVQVGGGCITGADVAAGHTVFVSCVSFHISGFSALARGTTGTSITVLRSNWGSRWFDEQSGP